MPSILADIYWAGSLLPKILMILFTQSTAVLHKYLNDELKILCCNFSLRLHRIPEFSMFREIPEYSRFSKFVATLFDEFTSDLGVDFLTRPDPYDWVDFYAWSDPQAAQTIHVSDGQYHGFRSLFYSVSISDAEARVRTTAPRVVTWQYNGWESNLQPLDL